MPRPAAGELRHPIIIESLAPTRDAQGGMIRTWTQFAALRAKIANLSGNEENATSHGGLTGEARTEFTIRYVPGVDSSMRIRYGGQLYNIIHVNDFKEEHRFIIITCDTGANDG